LDQQLVLEPDPPCFDLIVKWATIMVTTREGYYNQGRSIPGLLFLRELTFLIGNI